METEELVTLSTRHISEQTAALLDKTCAGEITKTCVDALCVYRKSEYGWFIVVPALDDTDLAKTHIEDLDACLAYAHKLGCKWLCLDCDGQETDGLPAYEW